MDRPDVVLDEHLKYLDDLRESGVTNMFGATPFLLDNFPILTYDECKEVLIYWMKSFDESRP